MLVFVNNKAVTSTLDVVWTTRPGGGGRTERRFLDFVIGGVPLWSRLDVDFISPFGWLSADEQEASIKRFLRKAPADMSGGRTTLYVCPECADLGCGAVTTLVQREGDVIVWKDFGVQNNYDDVVHVEGFDDIGPFSFDVRQYYELFQRVRRTIQDGS